MNRILAGSLAGALFAAGTAGAGERIPRVDLRGVDLSTLSGAATALQRAQDAARAQCRGRASSAIHVNIATLRCRSEATRRAVEKIDAPLVRSLYESILSGEALANLG